MSERCPYLGLINARGGSKGIKNKNIKDFLGRPLITWSIEIAQKIDKIDQIVVSTDSPEIAKIASAYGASVPFMRPAELASDTALQFDAIYHALATLEADGMRYEAVILLQPTAPLRSIGDIENCIAMYEEGHADTIFTVRPCSPSLLSRLYSCDKSGLLSTYDQDHASLKGTNRQQGVQLYERVGCVYMISRDTIIEQGRLYGNRIRSVVVDREHALDIDEPFDWVIAESMGRSLGLVD